LKKFSLPNNVWHVLFFSLDNNVLETGRCRKAFISWNELFHYIPFILWNTVNFFIRYSIIKKVLYLCFCTSNCFFFLLDGLPLIFAFYNAVANSAFFCASLSTHIYKKNICTKTFFLFTLKNFNKINLFTSYPANNRGAMNLFNPREFAYARIGHRDIQYCI
jgi:hypothetical protein